MGPLESETFTPRQIEYAANDVLTVMAVCLTIIFQNNLEVYQFDELLAKTMEECEILVIDEIGKFSVESEEFVEIVRKALERDMPTILTLHKKSRHPLLQDIRRRDDSRILEVTPVNRALLPYKIHKLVRETY